MSRFEYLSALVSIVIALGLTEISAGWLRLLRNRARVRFSTLHAAWSLFSVLMLIQLWWGFWQFRTVEAWSFPGLLAVVGESLLLAFAGTVLLPEVGSEGEIDLRSYFLEQSRLYFSMGAAVILLLTVTDLLVAGQPFLHAENAFRLPGAIVAVTAAVFPNPRLHSALALLAFALFTGFVAFAFVP